MIALNLKAIISNGKVVTYSIEPEFVHDAQVRDKREYFNLKKVLEHRVDRFVKRREGGRKAMHSRDGEG